MEFERDSFNQKNCCFDNRIKGAGGPYIEIEFYLGNLQYIYLSLCNFVIFISRKIDFDKDLPANSLLIYSGILYSKILKFDTV